MWNIRGKGHHRGSAVHATADLCQLNSFTEPSPDGNRNWEGSISAVAYCRFVETKSQESNYRVIVSAS